VIGRTVLVIAHRLSTIRQADKILVLQYGKIVEEGTHLDLINKRGLYYQLVKRQTEQNDREIKTSSIELHPTTVSIGIPLTDKNYSTSFSPTKSI
jgi:ABC-type multidrug transport system ATPase subunit